MRLGRTKYDTNLCAIYEVSLLRKTRGSHEGVFAPRDYLRACPCVCRVFVVCREYYSRVGWRARKIPECARFSRVSRARIFGGLLHDCAPRDEGPARALHISARLSFVCVCVYVRRAMFCLCYCTFICVFGGFFFVFSWFLVTECLRPFRVCVMRGG